MRVPVTGNYEVDSAAVKAALEAERLKASAKETAKHATATARQKRAKMRAHVARTKRQAKKSVIMGARVMARAANYVGAVVIGSCTAGAIFLGRMWHCNNVSRSRGDGPRF